MYIIGLLIGLLIFGLALGIDENKKPKKTYYIKDGFCYRLDNQLLKELSLTWDEYVEDRANLDRTDVCIRIIN